MKRPLIFALMCASVMTACNKGDDPAQPERYALTVPVVEHGAVTITVDGKAVAAETIKAEEDAAVTLTAKPDVGYEFGGWTTTGITLTDKMAESIAFVMPAKSVTLTAAFSKPVPAEYSLTVPVVDNGTVAITVDGKAVTSETTQLAAGAAVALTATPAAGYGFDGWKAKGIALDDPKAESVAFAMPAKNVTLTASFSKPEPEGVTINGVTWALANVDVPGTFAANPESYGMFYQFNRRTGWSSTDQITSTDGSTWNNESYTAEKWLEENDPCPEGWRIPTYAEQTKLTTPANVEMAWTTQNEITGFVFTDKENKKSIFLPAAGARSANTTGDLVAQTTNGNYWSNERYQTQPNGITLGFYSGGCRAAANAFATGQSIRCVKQ